MAFTIGDAPGVSILEEAGKYKERLQLINL